MSQERAASVKTFLDRMRPYLDEIEAMTALPPCRCADGRACYWHTKMRANP